MDRQANYVELPSPPPPPPPLLAPLCTTMFGNAISCYSADVTCRYQPYD